MKTAKSVVILAILLALPGCGSLVMTYHNVAQWTGRHWSAEKAWGARKWMYADIPCRGSFKSGFKAGYRFACGGYDSCEPPQLRHYWRIGGLTESERQNAQAWSDGFTHGTVAAQQDHSAGPSALDMAAMQPPQGVPDVRYYSPPPSNEMSQEGGFQYSPEAQAPPSYATSSYPPPSYPPPSYSPTAMPGNPLPPAAGSSQQYVPNAGNVPYVPSGNNTQYSPAAMPLSAPASEAMPATANPLPAQRMPLPPPAPASLPAADARLLPGPLTASEGSPGLGNVGSTAALPPAPPAELIPESLPQQSAATPPPQAAQAADWQLPLIRE